MSMPPKPGWYWWRFYSGAPWIPQEVRHDSECKVDAHGGLARHTFANEWGPLGMGEWGERIHDNDRLKAMKELAAADPKSDGSFGGCTFCGGGPTAPAGEFPPLGAPIVHKPDCPWLRAQEGG